MSIVVLFTWFTLSYSPKTAGQEPLDGRNRIFRDALLNNLVGDWKLTRKIHGQTVQNTARAEWVLNHHFCCCI